MNALSVDTATGVLSLCAASGDWWASLSVQKGLQHSPSLIPLAERLLQDLSMTVRDLQLVVCSTGPGSFTGIRIGIATALGIGHGRGIPVVGVSTLDALGRAWKAYGGDVFPVIDARRGNIYTARYEDGLRKGDYLDVSPAELAACLARANSPLLVGADAPRIREILGDSRVPVSDIVEPKSMLRLGVQIFLERGAATAPPLPLYLRKSEAERVSGR